MSKSLTLGSLFDGSGGFPLAGMMAGIVPVWASEIEPFPIRVTTRRIPQMKHYGDISKINGGKIEPVDIITFGSPCFSAGTLVLTDKGYVEIENIKRDMKVLTHKGRWRKVTAIGSKMGETVILKGNHYGLECTPNHPIYSAEIKHYYPWLQNGKRADIRLISEDKNWTPAENMQSKLWAVPNKIEKIPITKPCYTGDYREKVLPSMDEDFFYFVGRWLGDGWVRDGQRPNRPKGQKFGNIILCDSLDKEDELRCIIEKVTDHYSIERCRTAVKFKFTSKVFCEWLTDNFGKYAGGKKIPSWVYGMDEKYRKALLDGVLNSDGYRLDENKYKVCTTSKKLAHGLRLLAETLGYSTTVYKHKSAPTKLIEGRLVNQKEQFIVQLTKSKTVKRLSDEKHSWYKVRSVQPTCEIKRVYNLTVDEDNSYIADDVVVHNCQDLSLAGKRSGLDGAKSSMFFEAIRVIKEMREATNGKYPRWIVWENVPGALSSSKGQDFRTVLEEICKIKDETVHIPMPEKKWSGAGEIVGDDYSAAYRILNAQFFGVPQRRRRIFLVADFRGQSAGKILFESEGLFRDFTQERGSWQRAAANAETGIRETGIVCLNDQGGQRMDITEEMTSTLRAKANHPPCVMESAGFCTEHSAKARGIGYEIETSPTLRQGTVPAALAIENHLNDSRMKIDESGTVQTLTGRAGTGGGNVPMVMNEREHAGTILENMANTLMATDYKGTQCVFENHSQDTRYTGPLDVAQTVSATYGKGGNNQPFVVSEDEPKTMKIRSGCEGGGKGALIQDNQSATLGCNNDQTVFVPFCKGTRPHSKTEGQEWREADTANTLNTFDVGENRCNELAVKAYGICSKDSNSMKSDNPNSGIYETDTARTLDANGGNPGCNQGGIAVVESYAIQGSMIGRKEENGPNGDGINEEVSFTLNTVDRHAVYALDRASYNQGKNAQFDISITDDGTAQTVVAKGPGAVASFYPQMKAESQCFRDDDISNTLVNGTNPGYQNGIVEPIYTVRRLTPLECCRLQGFPDYWCDNLETENPTEEEILQWTEIFETHRKALGKSSKQKSEKQIIKWLKNPYSDSAMYAMWGNAIAVPCVFYVLNGIAHCTE